MTLCGEHPPPFLPFPPTTPFPRRTDSRPGQTAVTTVPPTLTRKLFPIFQKRQVTAIASAIPAYASTSSGAVRYASACSCIHLLTDGAVVTCGPRTASNHGVLLTYGGRGLASPDNCVPVELQVVAAPSIGLG